MKKVKLRCDLLFLALCVIANIGGTAFFSQIAFWSRTFRGDGAHSDNCASGIVIASRGDGCCIRNER